MKKQKQRNKNFEKTAVQFGALASTSCVSG